MCKLWIFYLFYRIKYCSVSIIGLKKHSFFFPVTTHNDQFIGFSTARGEKLSISEDAIEKANFVLSDENINAYAEKDTGKNTKNVISKSLNGTNIKGAKSIRGNTLIIPKQVSSKSTDIFYEDKVNSINKCESGEFFLFLKEIHWYFHEVKCNIDNWNQLFYPVGSLEYVYLPIDSKFIECFFNYLSIIRFQKKDKLPSPKNYRWWNIWQIYRIEQM